jgi:hypothetical protein
MTLFEYVAVAASLVCSFAAVRLLGGAAAAIRPDRRYWVHATFVLALVFLVTNQWWFFWSYRDVEWDYGRFMIALLPLGILYVMSTLLIPADAGQVRSWRRHYFEVRVRFFTFAIALLAALVLDTVVLLGHPVIHARRVIPAVLGAAFAAGMVSDHPKLHATIALVAAAMCVVVGVVFVRPASFGVAP